MATLADHSPSSDDEVAQPGANPRASLTTSRLFLGNTLAPVITPRKKDLVPKSTGSVSPRKVRKLGSQSAQGLTNPLFQPWNAENDSGSQSRCHSVMMESPKKLGLVTEFEHNSPPQTVRRPRHTPSTIGLPTLDTSINLKLDKISRYSLANGRKSSYRQNGAADFPSFDHDENDEDQLCQDNDLRTRRSEDNSNTSNSDTYQVDSDSFRDDKDDAYSVSSDSDDVVTSRRRTLNSRAKGKKRVLLPTLKTLGNPLVPFLPTRLGSLNHSRPKSRRALASGSFKRGPEASFASSQTHDSFEENTIFSERCPTNEQQDNLLSKFERLNLGDRQKARDESRQGDSAVVTPPVSPIKSLASPRKFRSIPQAPYRPSEDSHWDQTLINGWNDENSQSKSCTAPASPKKAEASPKRVTLKEFNSKKRALAESFLHELDTEITGGKILELARDTGGVSLVWTKTLNTTAGRANWRRETTRAGGQATSSLEAQHKHYASIELAEKVIDDENKLLNVIAHEFCHLANFMISGITKNPHGREFKSWAVKCSNKFGSRGIQVTTKHTYDIDFRYMWECTECGQEYKRHSKSVDPNRHRCGSCKGPLKQTRPARKAGSSGNSKPSEYQLFMRQQMKVIRKDHPGVSQKELMGIVAAKWADAKKGGGLDVGKEPDEESVSAMLAEQLGCPAQAIASIHID